MTQGQRQSPFSFLCGYCFDPETVTMTGRRATYEDDSKQSLSTDSDSSSSTSSSRMSWRESTPNRAARSPRMTKGRRRGRSRTPRLRNVNSSSFGDDNEVPTHNKHETAVPGSSSDNNVSLCGGSVEYVNQDMQAETNLRTEVNAKTRGDRFDHRGRRHGHRSGDDRGVGATGRWVDNGGRTMDAPTPQPRLKIKPEPQGTKSDNRTIESGDTTVAMRMKREAVEELGDYLEGRKYMYQVALQQLRSAEDTNGNANASRGGHVNKRTASVKKLLGTFRGLGVSKAAVKSSIKTNMERLRSLTPVRRSGTKPRGFATKSIAAVPGGAEDRATQSVRYDKNQYSESKRFLSDSNDSEDDTRSGDERDDIDSTRATRHYSNRRRRNQRRRSRSRRHTDRQRMSRRSESPPRRTPHRQRSPPRQPTRRDRRKRSDTHKRRSKGTSSSSSSSSRSESTSSESTHHRHPTSSRRTRADRRNGASRFDDEEREPVEDTTRTSDRQRNRHSRSTRRRPSDGSSNTDASFEVTGRYAPTWSPRRANPCTILSTKPGLLSKLMSKNEDPRDLRIYHKYSVNQRYRDGFTDRFEL